jgi:hypothetical protein
VGILAFVRTLTHVGTLALVKHWAFVRTLGLVGILAFVRTLTHVGTLDLLETSAFVRKLDLVGTLAFVRMLVLVAALFLLRTLALWVCYEHVGPCRSWYLLARVFVYMLTLMGTFIEKISQTDQSSQQHRQDDLKLT